MNKNNNFPFEKAQIEIVKTLPCDVITASYTGADPFPGEDDEFTTNYWDN